jgi:hypothetical protein
MLEQTESSNGYVQSSDQIIQSVKFRHRICEYLFKAAAGWFAIGVAVFLLALIFAIKLNGLFRMALIISAGLFTAAFALTLAIYRCPVCDTYLSRFRPDKLHCPACDAKVK